MILINDIRFAVRGLVRSPLFSIVDPDLARLLGPVAILSLWH